MSAELSVSVGQYSDKGVKPSNQDFHGILVPEQPTLSLKGIAIAIADGISSSNVSHIASETAVKSFLTDYYCTSDAWTVKTAAQRVISATNSWLYAQTRASQYAYDQDKGYVATFSAIVMKAATAHVFHVGDSRIYRLNGRTFEQLTEDHRIRISSQENYLARALGVKPNVEIDYRQEPLAVGDVYILATDGIYEFIDAEFVADAIDQNSSSLDDAARLIAEEALRRGSDDNLTVQIVRVETVANDSDASELTASTVKLPLPPLLEPRQQIDGYTVLRRLYASARSHVYLVEDSETGERAVLKAPSVEMKDDGAHMRRFMMEDWIARRINSAHVLKAHPRNRRPASLYTVTEYIEGRSLTQWMHDNPRPALDDVRNIADQIAKGLRAFHRMEMVHQDLRPENIMIDRQGTVKLIDFGSTKVAGVSEATPRAPEEDVLGTVQYSAPEYLYGDPGSESSDIFSLGVIVYQMLTGKLPYGTQAAKVRTRKQAAKLRYTSACHHNPRIPDWVDGALKKAIHPDPFKRYDALSAFMFDISQPNPQFLGEGRLSLAERNPLMFWKALTAIFALSTIALAIQLYSPN